MTIITKRRKKPGGRQHRKGAPCLLDQRGGNSCSGRQQFSGTGGREDGRMAPRKTRQNQRVCDVFLRSGVKPCPPGEALVTGT